MMFKQITGTNGDETLTGTTENDVLDGLLGDDTLIGGWGNDVYTLNDLDTIIENAGEGTDTVRSSLTSYALGSNLENLILTGLEDINGIGNNADNIIIGNSGDNHLNGRGGDDILMGGLGDDVYRFDDFDAIIENAGEGNDTVYAMRNYQLADNLENLVLLTDDDLYGGGNDLDNNLLGNGGGNHLSGGGGNDTLNGGDGLDTLIGGRGNDSYWLLDWDDDSVIESAGQGNDTVYTNSEIGYVLGANVENLTLVGTGDIKGTGNSADNILIGNDGDNTLAGRGGNDTLDGGEGFDKLVGGDGNDTYFSNMIDTVVEDVGGGIDTVIASGIYNTLADNVENMILAGSADIHGFGNALDNVITGNDGHNSLSGGEGGNDTLIGGKGNDTYILTGAGDTIVENAGEGIDTVGANFSFSLVGTNLENLYLDGTRRINGTGNDADNIIYGTTGNNILTGGDGDDTLEGGLGEDTLIGGNGKDNFIFDATGFRGNVDKIEGFVAADDTIQLDHDAFTQLSFGALKAQNFLASKNGNAADANDYILYETDTGKLYYDADGSGRGDKELIAVVAKHPGMTFSDFDVI